MVVKALRNEQESLMENREVKIKTNYTINA